MTLLDFLEKYWVFLCSGIVFPAYWYAMKATFATKPELDTEKRRITTLEGKVEALPSAKDFHTLSEKLMIIIGDIKAMNSDMTHVKKNVDMLVETEFKRGKK